MSEDFDPFSDEEHHLTKEQMEQFSDVKPMEGMVVGSTADEPLTVAAIVGEQPPEDPDDIPEPGWVPISEEAAAYQGLTLYREPLPLDLASVWGATTANEVTARTLVAAWGIEGFRASSMHKAAVIESARSANLSESRTDFRTERAKKK